MHSSRFFRQARNKYINAKNNNKMVKSMKWFLVKLTQFTQIVTKTDFHTPSKILDQLAAVLLLREGIENKYLLNWMWRKISQNCNKGRFDKMNSLKKFNYFPKCFGISSYSIKHLLPMYFVNKNIFYIYFWKLCYPIFVYLSVLKIVQNSFEKHEEASN